MNHEIQATGNHPKHQSLFEELSNWYWQYGAKRTGAFALSPLWLHSLYQQLAVLQSVDSAQDQKKLSVGVWGPSQTGKSTLISSFCDETIDSSGQNGALHWDQPTVFSSKVALPPDVTVFNPHNYGSDASGCISRFVQRRPEEVVHKDAPVEIVMLSRPQVMHALSAGYASECRTNALFSPEKLEELLGNLKDVGTTAINRDAFQQLFELISVLRLLLHSRDSRYLQLADDDDYSSFFNRLLSANALLTDPSSIKTFGEALLWDSNPRISATMNKLEKLRESLSAGRFFCSMQVAALLVNIDSFKVFLSNKDRETLPPGIQSTVNSIRNLRCVKKGSTTLIQVSDTGDRLFSDDDSFGYFQGLIRELVIPLKEISSPNDPGRSIVTQFFAKSDIVDFPGVPLQDKDATENLIDLSKDKIDESLLLTKVLKRGKVASLVIGYGETLKIDAFMLLVRAGNFPAKPDQLHRGITAWWNSYDPSYDVYSRQRRKPPLPLFFNMTFFSNIVNKVAQRASINGLDGIVGMVKQLDPLVATDVATLLTTTYPHFDEGRININDDQLKKSVLETILSDPSFGPRIANSLSQDSLRHMITDGDGGVRHLFKVLAETLSVHLRQSTLTKRRSLALIELISLFRECVPAASDEMLQRDVEALKKAIDIAIIKCQDDNLHPDPIARVSYLIRRLLDVVPSDLEPLPPSGLPTAKYEAYVVSQLNRWSDSKDAIRLTLHPLEIEPAPLKRILAGMCNRVDTKSIAAWIMKDLPQQRTREDSRELRRPLAAYLSKKLLSISIKATLPMDATGAEKVIRQIGLWADAENNDSTSSLEHSPHYTSVIAPVLELLDELPRGLAIPRPDQLGDSEAEFLLQKLDAFVS